MTSSPRILHTADSQAPRPARTVSPVRTPTGVDRTDPPAIAGELPPVRMSSVPVEAVAVKALSQNEDEHFQWFVDLFVAEYAAEATVRPDASI